MNDPVAPVVIPEIANVFRVVAIEDIHTYPPLTVAVWYCPDDDIATPRHCCELATDTHVTP